MTVIILDWDFSHYYRRVDERFLTLDEAVEQVKVHERRNKSIKTQIANRIKALIANKATKAQIAVSRSDEQLKETLTDLRDNTAELNRIKRHLHALINAGVEALPQPDPRLSMPEHQRALYAGFEWVRAKNEWVAKSNGPFRV
jgi:outer membrane protein TolC